MSGSQGCRLCVLFLSTRYGRKREREREFRSVPTRARTAAEWKTAMGKNNAGKELRAIDKANKRNLWFIHGTRYVNRPLSELHYVCTLPCMYTDTARINVRLCYFNTKFFYNGTLQENSDTTRRIENNQASDFLLKRRSSISTRAIQPLYNIIYIFFFHYISLWFISFLSMQFSTFY